MRPVRASHKKMWRRVFSVVATVLVWLAALAYAPPVSSAERAPLSPRGKACAKGLARRAPIKFRAASTLLAMVFLPAIAGSRGSDEKDPDCSPMLAAREVR